VGRMIVITESDRKRFIVDIMRRKLDGKKKFIAEFSVYRAVRSNSQNGLYRKWLTFIKWKTGIDEDALHEEFKEKFLPWVVKKSLEGDRGFRLSTKGLTTTEFSDYMERIRQFMIDKFEIVLPYPDDREWDEFVVFTENNKY
jgi:hypothetical protein